MFAQVMPFAHIQIIGHDIKCVEGGAYRF
jgi:hypothetical protein